MSEHYTDGRRWSYISKAWIFVDSWNDREEIARLEATLRQVEEERDALLSEKGPAADYWGRACARVLDREKAAWQSRDQAREKLRQAEAERDQARADTQSMRELVGQWIWAMYLTPESYECRTIETYRQAVEARVRQLEELVQAELPPPLRRLEQQELLRLRARVVELEEALRVGTFREGANEHPQEYERWSALVDEGLATHFHEWFMERALEGKEEHGTRRDG